MAMLPVGRCALSLKSFYLLTESMAWSSVSAAA
jgi:hypothetical protein